MLPTVASSGTTQFRVTATDRAGNTGTPAAWPALRPALVQQSAPAVVYRGTWRKASSSRYSGGSVRYATAARATTTFSFTGRSIAFVSLRAAGRGKVKVYVDGSSTATVLDLRGATACRWVAWTRQWSTSGRHTVRLVVAGTLGRPRVDVDAFAVLR